MGMNYMNTLERFFDCAGTCSVSVYHSFSDVSLGPPSQSCKDSIVNYITNNFVLITVVGIIISVCMLLGVFASAIVCCCKKKSDEDTLENTNANRVEEDELLD